MGNNKINNINNLSEKEFYRYHLKDITREQIDISAHATKKINSRHIGIEHTLSLLTESFHKKIHKNEDGDFEVHYNSPNKKDNDIIVIIAIPLIEHSKSIRIITVYNYNDSMIEEKNVRQYLKMKQDYDVQTDALFFFVPGDYDYKKTVRMSEDLLLDLDQNEVPVAIEILHASKVFGINSKYPLTQPIGIVINIDIAEDLITLEAHFKIIIRQKTELRPVKAEINNLFNLPKLDMHIATA